MKKNVEFESKVFMVSAPLEQENTGDYDYANMLSKAMNNVVPGSAEYITEKKGLYKINEIKILQEINASRNKWSTLKEKLNLAKDDPARKRAVANVMYFILDNVKGGQVPILNIHLRTPETGMLFMPEDLKQFQDNGILVAITCHEYKLNNTRRHLQAVAQNYFAAADYVIFFNEKDRNNAAKHASHEAFATPEETTEFPLTPKGHNKIPKKTKDYEFTHPPYNLAEKSGLSVVPPTVAYDFGEVDKNLTRPPNMIIFGIIREDKGIEPILDIASQIPGSSLNKKTRIIIAGYPSSDELTAKIINTKYDREIITKEEVKSLKEKGIPALRDKLDELASLKEVNPIDLYLDVSPEEMQSLFKQAKYSVKYDGKGWANNASGQISAVANGCILYTGWGFDTPDNVLPRRTKTDRLGKNRETPAGEYNKAIVFLGNKYALQSEKHLAPSLEKKGEKRKHYAEVGAKAVKDRTMVTAQTVIEDIAKREKEQEENFDVNANRTTLNMSAQLIQEQFAYDVVGQKYLETLSAIPTLTTLKKHI